MDDFSKFQQINAIARELMKHGQASTMDEAMRKAKQQVDSGVAIMPVQQIEVPQMPPMEGFAGGAGSGGAHDEVFKKLESIIAQQQSVISNVVNTVNANSQTLASANSKISSLTAEIAELKSKVEKLAQSPAPAPMRSAEPSQQQFKQESSPAPQPAPSAPAHPPPGGTERNHARTGNFQPNDVSIEKFFYFGPGGAKK